MGLGQPAQQAATSPCLCWSPPVVRGERGLGSVDRAWLSVNVLWRHELLNAGGMWAPVRELARYISAGLTEARDVRLLTDDS